MDQLGGRDPSVLCLRLNEWGGDLELAEVERPSAGVNDVVVEVAATSVGRSVFNYLTGYVADSDEGLPVIPAHEVVGRVVETGPGVEHVDVDDFVAAYTYLTCGHCDPCWRGLDPLCENLAGRLGVDIDGGFAEFVRLPAANAIGIPEMDPVGATVVPDAVATPVHVARQRAPIEPGDDVMVIGAGGGVGIHLVQVARHFGASVTAVDLDAGKLAECARLGADHAIDTSETGLAEYADGEGLRFDAVVDFVGSMAILEEAAGVLDRRGRLVNLTVFEDRSFPISPRQQVFGETEVVGSRSFAKHELREAAELVADGVVEPVVSEVVGLEGVPGLLESIGSNALLGRGAVVP